MINAGDVQTPQGRRDGILTNTLASTEITFRTPAMGGIFPPFNAAPWDFISKHY